MCGSIFHCVNSSSPEGPEDLSFFDPHSDNVSPYFSVRTRDRKS